MEGEEASQDAVSESALPASRVSNHGLLSYNSLSLLLVPKMDSSAPPPPPNPQGDTLPKAAAAAATATTSSDDVAMEAAPTAPEEEPLPEDIINASPEDIMTRVRLIDNDLKVSASRPRHPPRIAGRGHAKLQGYSGGVTAGTRNSSSPRLHQLHLLHLNSGHPSLARSPRSSRARRSNLASRSMHHS